MRRRKTGATSWALGLLADYLDGVAPPVPSLDLSVQSGEVLRRYDYETKIESWLFTMGSQAVAQMYERAGIRLFARNIRGFLGSSEINRAMETTLTDEPEYFWYYNNGITVVCDHAEQVRNQGQDVIRVQNPQVINGQQTTRMLSRSAKGKKASVLVRVICVPRAVEGRHGQFDRLVSAIVGVTNSQNPVRPSDLMSNDRRQIEIERQLRQLDYGYIRKRQTKGEARRSLGAFRRLIKKDEHARSAIRRRDTPSGDTPSGSCFTSSGTNLASFSRRGQLARRSENSGRHRNLRRCGRCSWSTTPCTALQYSSTRAAAAAEPGRATFRHSSSGKASIWNSRGSGKAPPTDILLADPDRFRNTISRFC